MSDEIYNSIKKDIAKVNSSIINAFYLNRDPKFTTTHYNILRNNDWEFPDAKSMIIYINNSPTIWEFDHIGKKIYWFTPFSFVSINIKERDAYFLLIEKVKKAFSDYTLVNKEVEKIYENVLNGDYLKSNIRDIESQLSNELDDSYRIKLEYKKKNYQRYLDFIDNDILHINFIQNVLCLRWFYLSNKNAIIFYIDHLKELIMWFYESLNNFKFRKELHLWNVLHELMQHYDDDDIYRFQHKIAFFVRYKILHPKRYLCIKYKMTSLHDIINSKLDEVLADDDKDVSDEE